MLGECLSLTKKQISQTEDVMTALARAVGCSATQLQAGCDVSVFIDEIVPPSTATNGKKNAT